MLDSAVGVRAGCLDTANKAALLVKMLTHYRLAGEVTMVRANPAKSKEIRIFGSPIAMVVESPPFAKIALQFSQTAMA